MTTQTAPISVAAIGECMIELQEIEPGKTQQTFGGDTLNAAIYMARLADIFPVQVDYVTALGTDSFSEGMKLFWEKEGVSSSMVLQLEGELPGLYYIQLDENGERHFSYWRGQAAAKKCFECEGSATLLKRLADYDVIYLSGISLAILTEKSRANLMAALVNLYSQGKKIYFDYNYRPHLWPSVGYARQAIDALLPLCNTVFVGLDELAALHNVTVTAEGHKYLAAKGVAESIIRSGSAACTIYSNTATYEIPAQKVEKVIDTTAAGDSFSGTYLVARNSGISIEEAAAIAHRMAAYVIQYKGAVVPKEFMPDLQQRP